MNVIVVGMGRMGVNLARKLDRQGYSVCAIDQDPERLESLGESFGGSTVEGVALLVISYVCGTAQLMVVGSMGVAPAMAAAVLPFILPDAAKLAIGVGVGCAVDKALSSTLSRA